MLNKILATDNDKLPFILRLSLGLVMLPHGAQKMLGWFGGDGFSATVTNFQNYMHIPAFLAVLVILTEFVGALLLIFGAAGRLAALAIGVNLLVAMLMVHTKNGFFMNWTGKQAGEGFEYFVFALPIAFSLVWKGSGAYSIDRLLTRSKAETIGLPSSVRA